MKNLVIFGSGYHAKVIFWEALKLKKYKILGFIDDKVQPKKVIVNYNKKKFINLGSTRKVNLNLFIKNKRKISGIIGIGSNKIREKIKKQVNKLNKNFKWEKIISSSAIIDSDVIINEGTFVSSGAIIKNGSIINKHCLINTSSSIDHDNIFEDFSSCGPGTITGGNVKVGQLSHLGIGSVIKEKITIEKNVLIGGNSFVNRNCQKNKIYFGSPAKKKNFKTKIFN